LAEATPGNTHDLGYLFMRVAGKGSACFEYIEVFYNRQRLHSSPSYMTPDEFERKCNEQKLAAND